MTLAATAKLAPHFTAGELQVTDAPADVVANARTLAAWLESTRAIFGAPVRITSGYRTPEHNAEVGGSATSDHVNGLAADFTVDGLTPFQVYGKLAAAQKAAQLAPFDQIVFYVADNHVHVGLGARMRGELLLKTAEGSYVTLAGAYLTKLRGYV